MRISWYASLVAGVILLLFIGMPSHLWSQIPVNTQYDQPPGPLAQSMFIEAFKAECAVFKEYNPAIAGCGGDTLIRTPTLMSWGATYRMPGVVAVTRYNPTQVTGAMVRFGQDAIFFIFAHEVGHHFDLQFPGAATGWGSIVYPPSLGLPVVLSYNWTIELRADAWGGCAIAATGRNILAVDALQIVTAGIETPQGVNPDIPPANAALYAINSGYNACQGSNHKPFNTPKLAAKRKFAEVIDSLLQSAANGFQTDVPDLPFSGRNISGTVSSDGTSVDYTLVSNEEDKQEANEAYADVVRQLKKTLPHWKMSREIDIVNAPEEMHFKNGAGATGAQVEVYLQVDPSWLHGPDRYEVHLSICSETN